MQIGGIIRLFVTGHSLGDSIKILFGVFYSSSAFVIQAPLTDKTNVKSPLVASFQANDRGGAGFNVRRRQYGAGSQGIEQRTLAVAAGPQQGHFNSGNALEFLFYRLHGRLELGYPLAGSIDGSN